MLNLTSKSAKILYSIAVSVIIAILWDNAWKITSLLGITSGSLLNKVIRDLIVIIPVLFLTALVIKPKEIFSFLGLDRNIIQGLGTALLCVSPLYMIFPVFGGINSDLTFPLLLQKSILPGFKEEFVCRAFMFGLLFQYAKTGFGWAVILPALYFGSMHLYQGHDALSALAAFGVTFIGALYFSWMYVEWNFNLWVPVGLHALMNGAWVIFSMEGTQVAAGGLISNIARVISILLAVGLTMWHKRKNGAKVFSYPVWQF
jgi:hypothetical protein